MAPDLTNILDGIDDLIPTDRNRLLIDHWLSLPDGDQRASLRSELDSKLKSSIIIPQDYALILRASQSIPWALHAVKRHKDKKIITVAIDVFEMTWKKDPTSFLKSMGGHDGLVDLINNVLPQIYVMRLFRAFGRPSPLLPEHISIVDALFRSIFPAFGSDTPLVRHAHIAIDHALTAASLDVVRVVLHSWEAPLIHNGTWSKLAIRRPEIAKEILLGQFEGLTPSPTTGRLDDPSHILTVIDDILRRDKDLQFWDRFAASYDLYLTQNASLPPADPVIAKLNGPFLLRIATIILEKEIGIEDRISRVITLCDLLQRVMYHHRANLFTWNEAEALVSLVCKEFGRSRWADYWTITSPADLTALSGSATIVGLLLAVFKHVTQTEGIFTGSMLILPVKFLPRKARFPFCHIFHAAKTGESLAEAPQNKASLPSFSAEFLSILHPIHGRLLLEVGLRSRGESFVHGQWLDATNDIDTQSLIQAAWVGAERGIAGDLGVPDEASAKACTAQVYFFKANASRSKEASDRVYNTKMALSICKLAHSPALFNEILSWAYKRYAKDVEIGWLLLAFVIQDQLAGSARFLAGPIGLYVSNGTRETFSKDSLIAWSNEGVNALRCILRLFKVWMTEPNHGQSSFSSMKDVYDSTTNFYFKVFTARIKLIEHIYPTLTSDLDELRAILLDPMMDFIMDWERFKVIEYPETLGFDFYNCCPTRVQDHVQIPRRISSVILQCLLDFGKKRQALYREGRQKLNSLNNELLRRSRWRNNIYKIHCNNSIMPCVLIVTKSTVCQTLGIGNNAAYNEHEKRHLFRSIDLAHGLEEHVESILFGDLDATAGSLDDRLDWVPNQFPETLHIYLRASTDRNEMVQRITRLFDHYQRTRGGHNLTLFLLRSSLVTSIIANDPALFTKVVGPWLPQYPAPDEPIEFDLFKLMPPVLSPDDETDTLVKVLQNPELLENSKLDYLNQIFRRPALDDYNNAPQYDIPVSVAYRVAILAVAWILTLLNIPTNTDLKMGDRRGIVSYAIRFVRVSQRVVQVTGKRDAQMPILMLSRILRILTQEEVALLIKVVFTAQMEEEKNLYLMMSVLRMVHRLAFPKFALEQVWQVLNLPKMSSWHRQALPKSILKFQDPQGAKDLLQELLVFSKVGQESRKYVLSAAAIDSAGGCIEERGGEDKELSAEGKETQSGQEADEQSDEGMDEDRYEGMDEDRYEEMDEDACEEMDEDTYEEMDEDADEEMDGDADEDKKDVTPKAADDDPEYFKVSTEKMVIQVLRNAFQDGVIDFDYIDSQAGSDMLVVTCSIMSSVADFLVEAVIRTWLLYGDRKTNIWNSLEPYIKIAQRVSEANEVTDEQWRAARSSTIPIPQLVEEYPVALALLHHEKRRIPWVLGPIWTENIAEPVLLGHINSRTRWLKAAVVREGGSSELEKSITATYSDEIHCAAAYRAFAPWFTYELIGDQEPILQIIESRVAPVSSRSACEALLELMDQNHSRVWQGTVYGRAVVSLTKHAIRDRYAGSSTALDGALLNTLCHDVSPSWLVDKISSTLTTIAVRLLHPENVMFNPDEDPDKVRPLDSFMSFFWAHTKSRRMESKLILNSCLRYVEEAQGQERIKSMQGLNGGATYWNAIIVLKLNTSFNYETIDALAGALTAVISSTVENGWYSAIYLPEVVQRTFVFPSYHVLARKLVHFVDTFTSAPFCPSELGLARSLTFQTAFAVLRANKNIVDASLSIKGEVEKLVNRWKDHEDGSVRWLAQSFRM